MKANKLFILLTLFCTALILSCAKYEVGYDGHATLTKYSFEPSSNPELSQRVEGLIEGDKIYIRVPNSIPIKNAVPSFTTNSEKSIVYVNNVVQQSGITTVDLSDTVQYRIATPSDMGFIDIIALRNASILKFGFYAADNEGVLFKDYEGTIEGLDIKVNLPVDADVTNLVARYTTSNGAVVKVNGTTQTSGQSSHDFTNSVQYDVTDEETIEPEKFVVTVGRLTAPEWMEMTSSVLSGYAVTDVRLAINPIVHLPSIVFGRSTSDGDGSRKAVVLEYDGTVWKAVGPTDGFSAGRVEAPTIAIDNNGTYYVAYKDYDNSDNLAQFGSVQKYVDGAWEYLKSIHSTPTRVNYLHIATNNDNVPIIGYSAANAVNGYANRNTNSEFYLNNNWIVKTLIAVQSSIYTRLRKGNDGKIYYANMDITGGTSIRLPMVYRLNDQTLTWELVSSQPAAPTSTTYGESIIDLTVDKDGTIYLVYQSLLAADKKSFVMKYDGSVWRQIGDVINHTAGSNAQRNNIALSTHPNGTLYFAHGDANGLKVTTFNEDTQNWNPAIQLASGVPDKIDLQISEEGIPYLATVIDGKIRVFKFDIP